MLVIEAIYLASYRLQNQNGCITYATIYSIMAANELSLSEPGLAQAQLMKIRVELVKHFELKSLAQPRLVTIRVGSRANAYMLTLFKNNRSLMV
jgi:hypothetical protein